MTMTMIYGAVLSLTVWSYLYIVGFTYGVLKQLIGRSIHHTDATICAVFLCAVWPVTWLVLYTLRLMEVFLVLTKPLMKVCLRYALSPFSRGRTQAEDLVLEPKPENRLPSARSRTGSAGRRAPTRVRH